MHNPVAARALAPGAAGRYTGREPKGYAGRRLNKLTRATHVHDSSNLGNALFEEQVRRARSVEGFRLSTYNSFVTVYSKRNNYNFVDQMTTLHAVRAIFV